MVVVRVETEVLLWISGGGGVGRVGDGGAEDVFAPLVHALPKLVKAPPPLLEVEVDVLPRGSGRSSLRTMVEIRIILPQVMSFFFIVFKH